MDLNNIFFRWKTEHTDCDSDAVGQQNPKKKKMLSRDDIVAARLAEIPHIFKSP